MFSGIFIKFRGFQDGNAGVLILSTILYFDSF